MDLEQVNKGISWPGDGLLDSTADPNISVSVIDEVPTLTVATIIGVIAVMLVAIAAVFLLGVLLDCRQQRLLDEKMNEVKRARSQRRVNTHPEAEDTSIADHMEESGMSVPPADMLRTIP